jgi:hypothetical protein
MKALLTLAVGLLLTFSGLAQDQPALSETSQISILTCSPGNELYSLFGHSAFRVYDPAQNLDVVFNYGTFAFDDDFVFNFTLGKLNYMLSVSRMEYFARSYYAEGRGVDEQILDLTYAEKQAVYSFLIWNSQSEHRTYLYDFFYDNCSSRLRDVLDTALGNAVEYPDLRRPMSLSFRNKIDSYLIYHPWGDFGIDLGLGLPCDQVMSSQDFMFLPDELSRALHGATLNGHPLVRESRTLIPAQVRSHHWRFTDPIPLMWILAGVFMALSAWGLRVGRNLLFLDAIYLFATGAVGLLIFFLWFISDHTATSSNFNILWAWPVHWIALPFFLLKASVRKWYALIYGSVLILTLICFFLLPQSLHLATIPVMVIGIARSFAHWRMLPQITAS